MKTGVRGSDMQLHCNSNVFELPSRPHALSESECTDAGGGGRDGREGWEGVCLCGMDGWLSEVNRLCRTQNWKVSRSEKVLLVAGVLLQ